MLNISTQIHNVSNVSEVFRSVLEKHTILIIPNHEDKRHRASVYKRINYISLTFTQNIKKSKNPIS